jgi:hypothetical protein
MKKRPPRLSLTIICLSVPNASWTLALALTLLILALRAGVPPVDAL